ncbi:hypothetical protein B0H14DRAFT_3476391 [Mycena olivaceomarginata]|nr:hypothetical protein B0H14DRAFT_3476391 [Mycena olivaceomarginata]
MAVRATAWPLLPEAVVPITHGANVAAGEPWNRANRLFPSRYRLDGADGIVAKNPQIDCQSSAAPSLLIVGIDGGACTTASAILVPAHQAHGPSTGALGWLPDAFRAAPLGLIKIEAVQSPTSADAALSLLPVLLFVLVVCAWVTTSPLGFKLRNTPFPYVQLFPGPVPCDFTLDLAPRTSTLARLLKNSHARSCMIAKPMSSPSQNSLRNHGRNLMVSLKFYLE